MKQRVLQVAVRHELVHQEHPASFAVVREAVDRHDQGRVEFRSEEELVLELTFPLERTGVHHLNGDGSIAVTVVNSSTVDRAKSPLTKAARV